MATGGGDRIADDFMKESGMNGLVIAFLLQGVVGHLQQWRVP